MKGRESISGCTHVSAVQLELEIVEGQALLRKLPTGAVGVADQEISQSGWTRFQNREEVDGLGNRIEPTYQAQIVVAAAEDTGPYPESVDAVDFGSLQIKGHRKRESSGIQS